MRAVAWVVAALVLAAPAHAQAPDVQGTYTLDARASDDVAKAIDDAVASMNFITRPIALSPDRSRLTLNVIVTSGRLPKPLTYKLVYQRTGD